SAPVSGACWDPRSAASRLLGRAGAGYVVDKLEVRHLGRVALARPELDDPRVATGAIREPRPDLAEELVHHVLGAEELERLPPGGHVAAPAERDHLLGDGPHLLGLRDGRLDPAVLDQ